MTKRQEPSLEQADQANDGTTSLTPDAGLARIETQLRSLRPHDLVIVSDMTGTIINQEHDGFSEQQRKNISFLLAQGTKIVLVTADPLSAVKEHFVEKLQHKGKGELFVLSSAGQEGHKVAPSESSYTEVCRGPDIELAHRSLLLESFISGLKRAISSELNISGQQRNSLLSGNRIKLREVSGKIPGQNSAIDIFPGKASIFFLDPDTPRNFMDQVFEAILENQQVANVIKDGDLKLFRGHNYLDILSCSKGDGLKLLGYKYPDIFRDKHILVLGDSANDEGLFLHEFPGARRDDQMRVFVGNNEELVGAINLKLINSNQTEIANMRGEYIKGTERLLQIIGAGANT